MSTKVSTPDSRVDQGPSGARKPLIEVPAVGAAANVLHTQAVAPAQSPAPVEKTPDPETAPPIAIPNTKPKTKAVIPRQPSRLKTAVGGAFSRMRGAFSAKRPVRRVPSRLWFIAAMMTCVSAGGLTYAFLWPAESSLQTVDVDEIDDLAMPTAEVSPSPVVNPAPAAIPTPAVMADTTPQSALPVPVEMTPGQPALAAPAGPALALTPPATPPVAVEPAAFQPGAKTHVVGVWLEGTIEEIPDVPVQSAAYDASQSRPR